MAQVNWVIPLQVVARYRNDGVIAALQFLGWEFVRGGPDNPGVSGLLLLSATIGL